MKCYAPAARKGKVVCKGRGEKVAQGAWGGNNKGARRAPLLLGRGIVIEEQREER